jgi:hypothetical protein
MPINSIEASFAKGELLRLLHLCGTHTRSKRVDDYGVRELLHPSRLLKYVRIYFKEMTSECNDQGVYEILVPAYENIENIVKQTKNGRDSDYVQALVDILENCFKHFFAFAFKQTVDDMEHLVKDMPQIVGQYIRVAYKTKRGMCNLVRDIMAYIRCPPVPMAKNELYMPIVESTSEEGLCLRAMKKISGTDLTAAERESMLGIVPDLFNLARQTDITCDKLAMDALYMIRKRANTQGHVDKPYDSPVYVAKSITDSVADALRIDRSSFQPQQYLQQPQQYQQSVEHGLINKGAIDKFIASADKTKRPVLTPYNHNHNHNHNYQAQEHTRSASVAVRSSKTQSQRAVTSGGGNNQDNVFGRSRVRNRNSNIVSVQTFVKRYVTLHPEVTPIQAALRYRRALQRALSK